MHFFFSFIHSFIHSYTHHIKSIIAHFKNRSFNHFNTPYLTLLYLADCRDIISPLLNVGGLRSKGVTLHMTLQSDRDAVPDAPAVYFIRPTEDNLKRVVADCSKQLYRAVYLHFVTRIEVTLLYDIYT